MFNLSGPNPGRLFWLSLFIVAMAQMEAAVVVLLRQLYYPEGFEFPIVVIRDRIIAIEIGREAATLIMLFAIAKIYSAGDRWRQYAAFLWGFGLWDILYYAWLWVMLRWPSSLLDWDVLFLIPLPWVAPVLAPVLIALVMMITGWRILSLRNARHPIRVAKLEWAVTAGGAIALLTLFMSNASAVTDGRMPRPFNWLLFVFSLTLPVIAACRAYGRSRGGSA